MSMLDANGSIDCAECGRRALAVRDRLKAENDKLRELVWRLLEIERIGATSNDWREIREQARELEIEVEG